MASLVADYSDSENEDMTPTSKSDAKTAKQVDDKNNTEQVTDDEDDYTHVNNAKNLLKDKSDSSSDSSEDETNEEELNKQQKPEISLDNPFRYFGSTATVTKEESVFQIEFRDQEHQRAAALERHVKMTPTSGESLVINGKKICWNYRKGKCRFGHNCTFAHDSDLIKREDDPSEKSSQSNPYDPNAFVTSFEANKNQQQSSKETVVDSTNSTSTAPNQNFKKRPNTTNQNQGLIPNKKALNLYYKSKSNFNATN